MDVQDRWDHNRQGRHFRHHFLHCHHHCLGWDHCGVGKADNDAENGLMVLSQSCAAKIQMGPARGETVVFQVEVEVSDSLSLQRAYTMATEANRES